MMSRFLCGRSFRAAVSTYVLLGAAAVPAALTVAVMTSAPLHAQLAGKGAITGTVTDPTGAVVPGATVTATNTATRRQRDADIDQRRRLYDLAAGPGRSTRLW